MWELSPYKTNLGWGEKVNKTLSPPSLFAILFKWLIIYLWPRCTPSNVPIVTIVLKLTLNSSKEL